MLEFTLGTLIFQVLACQCIYGYDMYKSRPDSVNSWDGTRKLDLRAAAVPCCAALICLTKITEHLLV